MTHEIETAILMADLSGYTAMTEIHGSQSAIDTVNKYMELAGKAMYGTSRFLERVGDQLVIVSSNAKDLAITALKLIEFSTAESNFLPVHAGLHFGKIIEQEGSFYGSAMNITARIAAKASDGKILCSSEFMEKAKPEGEFNFRIYDKVKFKNVLQPITLLELLPGKKYLTSGKALDPVCLMHVDKAITLSYMHNNIKYFFCSESCLHTFRNDPESFLSRE